MQLSISQIKYIESMCGSPFYLFDAQALHQNYNNLLQSFLTLYSNTIIAYSYKTNYLPYACNIIKEKGGYAEVVSGLEYSLALKIGYNPKRIIFNGPIKRYNDFQLALNNGTTINLDSFYELNYIARYKKQMGKANIKLGLRVNIDLSNISGNVDSQSGPSIGRFGFPSDKIGEVIRFLRDNDAEIHCLHGHCSSTNRNIDNFIVITQTLCNIRDEYDLKHLEYIDIGGGFFGKVPDNFFGYRVPSFDEYAESIISILMNNNWIRTHRPFLVIEPGISLAADTTSFITRVYDTKHIRSKNFAVVDGSMYNINPTMHSLDLPFYHIPSSHDSQTNDKQLYDVVGSTCMEKDVLLKDVPITGLKKGDYLQVNYVGAYTMVLTPPFINPAPAIVVPDGDTFTVARSAETFADFFSCYLF